MAPSKYFLLLFFMLEIFSSYRYKNEKDINLTPELVFDDLLRSLGIDS
jgi:hypothetical protein